MEYFLSEITLKAEWKLMNISHVAGRCKLLHCWQFPGDGFDEFQFDFYD